MTDDIAESGPGRTDPYDLAVNHEGITGRGDVDRVVDVCLDERRVWSFRFVRDSRVVAGRRSVAWPDALQKRLDGTGRVTLREHLTGTVYHEQHVTFGAGAGGLDLVDEQGHPLAVDKLGRLNRLLGEVDAAPMLDAIEQIVAALAECGVQPFLGYGTLLGAVREGDFIGHDHDADVMYLGAAEHPVDAILESYRVERSMRDRGFAIRRFSGISFKVSVSESEGTRGLDVFGGFYWDGLLYVMGQVRAPIRREQMVPATTVALRGRPFPAPRQPEVWLETAYGPGWRVPDPAFEFETPRSTISRFQQWFRGSRRGRAEWSTWYLQAGKAPMGKRSSGLPRWVAERETPDQVVDIACGAGSDALWWAQRGVAAYGCDYVPRAIERASRVAERRSIPAHFDLVNLADSRSALAYGAWVAGQPARRRIVTGCLAVDGVDPAARSSLWTLCRMLLRDGAPAYFEVLDKSDPLSKGHEPRGLLRAPSMPALEQEIRARGGEVRDRQVVESERGEPGPRRIRLVTTW